MENNSEASLNPAINAFQSATERNQDLALAKAQFLDLAEKFIEKAKAERGRLGALKSFLHNFNNGFIGEEIRAKLRKGRVRERVYYKWQKAFKEHGISGLLEKYHGSGPRMRQEIREAIERSICKNHLCRYRDIYDDLCLEFSKKTLPSYWAVRVYAKQYRRREWDSLVLMHEGKRGLRDRNMELVLGHRDGDLIEPNQRWEIDTTLADLMTERKVKNVALSTSDGKRCKVIGVIDVFSRSLKFYLTEKETGFAVGQLLKDRILTWGLPGELVIDNGKAFKNRRILSFLRKIETALHICIPANPVEKPFIERAFRTLTEEVFRGLEGYTGNCVANRPDEIEVKYTMAKVQEIIDRWAANIYDERIHSGTGQRPRERRNPAGFVPKTINEQVLDILIMEEHERTVRQGHICYLGDSYYHKSLPGGVKVKFRVDDLDASQLIVFHNGEYLCTATNFSRKGIKPSDIREARKERNRELRTRIKAHKELLGKYDKTETGVIARINAAEERKPLELPRKAEVVTFPAMERVFQGNARADQEPTGLAADLAGDVDKRPWFTSERHKYTWLRRRQKAGLDVSEEDLSFMEEFREDGFYQTVGKEWERRLDQMQEEASNEG